MRNVLEKEIETYKAKLPELHASVGKFALIKAEVIAGIYDTYADALQIGYERFKLEPFMVKQIISDDKLSIFCA